MGKKGYWEKILETRKGTTCKGGTLTHPHLHVVTLLLHLLRWNKWRVQRISTISFSILT